VTTGAVKCAATANGAGKMNEFASIAPKLGKLLRLLSSNSDGEVVATVRAIQRTLEGDGFDIHALAERIEEANGKRFSEADAHEIYRRGVEDGRRAAVEERRGFRSIDALDEPTWHEIALECAAHENRLFGEREKQFVEDMVRRTVHGGEPTEKQAAWLRKIYSRVRK